MKALATLTLLFLALTSFDQDKIYKKDRTVVECVITEIGLEEIKYISHQKNCEAHPSFP